MICLCVSVCSSERIIKIRQYLRKLCSNEKGDSQCIWQMCVTTCWSVYATNGRRRRDVLIRKTASLIALTATTSCCNLLFICNSLHFFINPSQYHTWLAERARRCLRPAGHWPTCQCASQCSLYADQSSPAYTHHHHHRLIIHIKQPRANFDIPTTVSLRSLKRQETQLSLTGRAQHHITVLPVDYGRRNTHIWRQTAVIADYRRIMLYYWDTDSERSVIGFLLWLARRSGTHWQMNCELTLVIGLN